MQLPPELLYVLMVWVFPLVAIFSTGLLIIGDMMTPPQSRVIRAAKMPWNRGKVIVEDIDESGQVEFLLMTPTSEGILKNPTHTEYRFTPTDVKDPALSSHNVLLRKRAILNGKPLYHSLRGSNIAAPPQLAALLEMADEARRDLKGEEERGKVYSVEELSKLTDDELAKTATEIGLNMEKADRPTLIAAIMGRQEIAKEVYLFNPLNTLKQWVKMAWPVESINIVRQEWQEFGRYGKPKTGLEKMILPLGLILLIVLGYWAYSQGMFASFFTPPAG